MPRRSFVKSVLGRPSRSYAKEAVSPWSDAPSYMNGTASRPTIDLLGGGSRRAGSDVSYAGPLRPHLASPPASDIGVPSAARRRPKKASSDIGYVPSASSYSIFPVSARPIIEDERETASEYSEVSESCERVPPAVVKRQVAPKKPLVRHTHFADQVEYMEEGPREPPPLRMNSNSSSASSDTQTSSATVSALMSPTSSVTVSAKPSGRELKPDATEPEQRDVRGNATSVITGSPTPTPASAAKPAKGVRFEAPPTPPSPPAAIMEVDEGSDVEEPAPAAGEPVTEETAPARSVDSHASLEGTAESVGSHDAFYTPRSSMESYHSQRSTESDVETPLAQVAEMPILPVFQIQPPTPAASSDTSEPNFLAQSPTRRQFPAQELAPRRGNYMIEEEDETDNDESYPEHFSHTTYGGHETYDSPPAETGAPVRPPLPRKSSKRPKPHQPDEPPTPPPKPKLSRNPSSSSTIVRGPGTVTSASASLDVREAGVTASGLTIMVLNERPMSRSSSTTERPARSRATSNVSDSTITRSTSSQSARKAKKERPPRLTLNNSPESDLSPPSSRPVSRASSMSQYSHNSDQLSVASRPGLGSEMSYGSSVSQRSGHSSTSIPASQSSSSRGANGKGGWAAARATPVVMYMPTTPNDGWAAFQPLPPRSRAMPLPGSHKKYDRESPAISAASSSVSGSAGGSVRGSVDSGPSYNNYAGPHFVPDAIPSSVSMPLNRAEFSPPLSPVASQTTAEFPAGGPSIMAPSPVRLPQKVMPPPVIDQPVIEESDTDSDDSLPKPSRSYVNTPTGSGSPGKSSQPSSLAGSRSTSPFAPISRDRRRSMPTAGSVSSSVSGRSSRKSWMPPGPVPPVPPIPASIASTLSRPSAPPSVISNGTDQSLRPMSPATRASLDRPSSLNPDVLTLLPEMSVEDSNQLYNSQPHGKHRRATSEVGGLTRQRSLFSRNPRQVKIDKPLSDVGHHRTSSEMGHGFRSAQSDVGHGYAHSEGGHSNPGRPFSPAQSVRSIPGRPFSPAQSLRRAEDGTIDLNGWDAASNAADIPVMESHGRDHNVTNGYTSLILPRGGAYKPDDPIKTADTIDPRILGMPTSAMAAVTFSSSAYLKARRSKEAPTPQHLQQFLPSPVDFTSHLKPPTKVHKNQILLQVYAVAVDAVDQQACDTKTDADVGKWIPGRSFVGRAVTVGAEELDIRRGDIIWGLTDVRKSGALAEYMVVERRRVARVPPNTGLSLEQMAALPSQGISAYRALQGTLSGVRSAFIMDAHIGIPALLCQQMRRQGISVTAVVPGGDANSTATKLAYDNGARGCLTGLPYQIMNGLEEGLFDIVVDTRGGEKTYTAAARVLAENGLIISLAGPAPEGTPKLQRKGTLKRMFSRAPRPPRFEEIRPAGHGEAEVDLSGLDTRDVLEDPNVGKYKPVIGNVVPFEKAPETFVYKPGTEQRLAANIVRIIN